MNSVKCGTETITSLGAKIWKILPNGYKELTSLSTFKSKIKNWETDKYPCRLCKRYIQRVGFISLGFVTLGQCLLKIIFLKFFVVVAAVVCFFVVAVVVVFYFLFFCNFFYFYYYYYFLIGVN